MMLKLPAMQHELLAMPLKPLPLLLKLQLAMHSLLPLTLKRQLMLRLQPMRHLLLQAKP